MEYSFLTPFQTVDSYFRQVCGNTPLCRSWSKLTNVVSETKSIIDMSQQLITQPLLEAERKTRVIPLYEITLDFSQLRNSRNEQKQYQLERVEFKQEDFVDEEDSNTKECFICRSNFVENETVLKTTCCSDHLIHPLCALECIRSTNSKCPFCRQVIFI